MLLILYYHFYYESLHVLTSPKPDSSSPEFDSWNSRLFCRTAEIEKRFEKYLEHEENICFPLRDKKKLRRKQMSGNWTWKWNWK